jgi:hypothetical protein
MYLDDQRPDPGRGHGPDATSGLGRILGPAPTPDSSPAPDSGPNPRRGPSGRAGRGRVVAILSGFAVLGAVIGVGTAEVVRSFEQPHLTGALTAARPSALISATEDESVVPPAPLEADTWGDPTAPSSTTAQAPTATLTPDYDPIPMSATNEPGLDFGFLTQVGSSDGTISLQFDRATYYTGAEATKRNGGKPPEDDYLIVNINRAKRSFDLDPNASVMAANRLLNRTDVVTREPLTVNDFVRNYQQALAAGSTGVPVWLRHSDGRDGPVTALAEQFLP